jgi:hypothetical protein
LFKKQFLHARVRDTCQINTNEESGNIMLLNQVTLQILATIIEIDCKMDTHGKDNMEYRK